MWYKNKRVGSVKNRVTLIDVFPRLVCIVPVESAFQVAVATKLLNARSALKSLVSYRALPTCQVIHELIYKCDLYDINALCICSCLVQ